MSQVIVDDQDPAVEYSGSWQHLPSTPGVTPAEYDHTKSGTADAGSTASLRFTGTQISVFGSQGSIDVYGQPVTTYAIDGQVVATYQAPVIQPGFFTAGTTFFSSGTLSAAEHTLVVTNINGTKPNVLWLDGFRYTPSEASPPPSSPPPPPSSPTQAPSSPSVAPVSNSPSSPSTPAQQASQQPQQQQQSSVVTPQSQATQAPQTPSNSGSSSQHTLFSSSSSLFSGSSSVSSSALPPSNGEPLNASSSTSSSRAPVGAIVGGIIGGLAILAAFFIAFVIWRRRKARAPPSDEFTDVPPVLPPPPPPPPEMRTVPSEPQPFEVRPFGTWRLDQEAPYTSGATNSRKGRMVSPGPGASSSSSENPFADSAASPQWTSTPSGSASPPESENAPSSVAQSEPLIPSSGSDKQNQSQSASRSEKSQLRPGVRRLPPTPGQTSPVSPVTPPLVAPATAPPVTPSEADSLIGSLAPIVRHHEDSGFRLRPRAPVVDIPPAYTRA